MSSLSIFYSYAAQDNDLRIKLDSHLAVLRQEGLITPWHDRLIQAGQEWSREIDAHLVAADIILLLISADFLASDYCYSVEMERALKRHKEGRACVIPIILRPVDWHKAPFSHLQALPTKGVPIVKWPNRDEAFKDVAENIRKVVEELLAKQFGGKLVGKPGGSARSAPPFSQDVLAQLQQLIQGFRMLRGQISDYVYLKGPKGFTVESCENQYNKLYADTMVFLTNYLPESVSGGADGFVAIVQGKSAVKLREREDPFVSFTRLVISSLAKFEKLAAQIDACAATLEMYKQKYFSASDCSS